MPPAAHSLAPWPGPPAFSVLVASAEWRAEVESWVHDRVIESGRRITGPLDQRRIRPWSTHLVVPTDAGQLWFKATCPSMSFEPALHELLATLVPDDVDRPFAIDAERGWIMTTDRGTTLGDSHVPTLDDWCAVVASAARLQQTLGVHRDAVLGTGVPDCSPSTVPERFDRLVDRFSALPPDHPTFVEAELADQLLAVRPRIVDAAAQAEASTVPTSLQHGDLHPWNVFATGDPPRRSLRIFDFGDVQWAQSVEVLSVPFGVIAEKGRLPWAPVRDAYVEQWRGIDARSLNALWESTAFTQPVNRTQTWWDCLAGATDDELAVRGAVPLRHLRRVLDA